MAEVVPTVLVGLDGATFDIIEPLVRQGRMPVMKRMMLNGARATLVSSTPPLSSIAWTTITTGVNPGRHGIFDFAHRKNGTYDFIPYTARDKKVLSIWTMFGEAGKKSCVVNVPLTYPAEPLRGVMISGFPRPTNAADAVYPASILTELERELGNTDFSKPKGMIRDGQESNLIDEIKQKTDLQLRVIEYLLKRDRYDFIMTVFDGIDVASHSLYRFIDPLHPKYDPNRSKDVRELLFRAYEIADSALGKLKGMFSEEVNFITISDHGSGPVYYGVCINDWLEKSGYLCFKRSLVTKVKQWSFRHDLNVYNLFRAARAFRILPSLEEAYVSSSFTLGLVKRFALSFNDVDWSKTRAYSFGNYGQIYVNLKGREPGGIVEAGPEYELLVAKLIDGIREIKDEKTGERIFDKFYRGSDLYRGHLQSEGPDVLFFDTEMLYNAHRIFEFGSSRLVSPHPIYSGNHKVDGIFLAVGPQIAERVAKTKFSIADITPTILELQAVESDYETDGVSLRELITAPRRVATRVGKSTQKQVVEVKDAFDEKENEELTKRLKNLGYV